MAWTQPRVDFCYACLPGGPVAPPPCRRCGSPRYFTNGLCDRCHPRGPRWLGSCVGCMAWGVYRGYKLLCWSCRWWHTHYPEGDCRCCGRRTTICEQRACRLCWEQARLLQEPGRAVDLSVATRFGQQLFFANLGGQRRAPHHHLVPGGRKPRPASRRKAPLPRLSRVERGQVFAPTQWRQQRLFDVGPDAGRVVALAERLDSDLVRYCDGIVAEHAAVHGWSNKQTNDVRRSLRLVAAQQATPGALIPATEVLTLPALQGNVSVLSTIDVLATAGLLIDDRPHNVERYFTMQTAGLPAPMMAQLRLWFDVMINGSAVAPRRRPRDPSTAKLQIRALAPILRVWAAQGVDSLVAVGREDIVAALPPPGARRHLADQGLRSLFGVLKARRAVFVDPTRGVPPTGTNRTIPLPLDAAAIRRALNSPDPATALAVALVGFHALTSSQVRSLLLTDIVDGRLLLGARCIPLAQPALVRLSAWLDHRARMWPETANAHLFVNRRTAPRRTPVSRPFPWRQVDFTPQTLREDRILAEVRATGGDVRLVCELFGLSVEGAMRYTTGVDSSSRG